jgi:hypothetical protein
MIGAAGKVGLDGTLRPGVVVAGVVWFGTFKVVGV